VALLQAGVRQLQVASISSPLLNVDKWLGRENTVPQIFSSAFMAFSHGSNDGQKFMLTFTLALVFRNE